MEMIVTEIKRIIKESATPIQREKAMYYFFIRFFCECVRLAFEQLDEEVATTYKQKGFRIERRDERTLHFLFGSVTYKRRRMSQKGQSGLYPLDKEMGVVKHQRYSPLVLSAVTELATKSVYRHVAQAIELLTPLSISHQKVNQLVIQVGDYCDAYEAKQEEIEQPIDEKKRLPIIYIEGDGVMIKGRKTGKKSNKLELHRIQVADGITEVNGRRELINPHYFTGLCRPKVIERIARYLENHYDLRETIVFSNSDGGSGYEWDVFEELALGCLTHEHFRDSYHVNRKIKERLSLAKDLQYPLIQAVQAYDKERVTLCLDTAESLDLDTQDEAHQENIRLLRHYLERNWAYLKPAHLRGVEGAMKGLGTCESNHRQYTYRMKRQGRIWSRHGAQSMVKVIDAVRNGELTTILNQLDQASTAPQSNDFKTAVRRALKKSPHQAHSGAVQGRIFTDGTRTSGMSKLARSLAG